MPLKLKSICGHRNVIVPEGNGMTLRQDAVIRAIVARRLQYAQMIHFKCRSYRLTRKIEPFIQVAFDKKETSK